MAEDHEVDNDSLRAKVSLKKYGNDRPTDATTSSAVFQDSPVTSPASSVLRFACTLGLALPLVAGCDSGDDAGAATGTEVGDTEANDSSDSEGTITVMVDDGTIYELVDVSSCDTSFTDPSGLPLSNGYDLTGRTADGAFLLSVGRAGFDDESVVFAGALEGDFDDEGQNAKMLYRLDRDTLDLTVDGANVTGTVGSTAIGPTRPHGDNALFTIDARCG